MVSSPSSDELAAYFNRLSQLLKDEEVADQARTAALATRCSFEELAQRSLACNGLSVSGVTLGLGGKSLVSLTRSSAFHSDPKLPSHGFRNGDPAKLISQTAVRKAGAKSKGAAVADEAEGEVEGVVYKITDTSITLAVAEPKDGEDVEFPERCRLIKTANTGTFDRMEKAIDRVRRIFHVPDSLAAGQDPASTPTPAALNAPEEARPAFTPPARSEDVVPSDLPAAAGDEIPIVTPADEHPTVKTGDPTPAPSGHPSLKLLQTLYGISPASFDTTHATTADIRWFDDSLNDSQKEAVRFVLAANEVGCIHGPPGTGKTHTLVEVIRQLVSIQGKRVLVCGASNLSVDNLLLRLSPNFAPTQITRIGHPARILPALLPSTLDYQTAHSSSGEIVKDVKAELEGHLNTLTKVRKEKGAVKGKKRGEVYGEVRELRKEFRKREGKVVRDVLSTTQIVLATCHTAGSRQLLREDFDVVLIDEATQALEAVCLIPILKARKLILAGDPCQLGPTVLSSKPSASRSAAKPSATSRSKKEKPSPRDDRPASTDAEPLPVDGTEQLLAPEAPSATIDDEEEGADASAALAPDEQLAASAALSAPARADTLAPLRNLRPLRSLETTLFGRLERLYGPGVKRILTVQYRMNASIAAYPSKALYASMLKSATSVATRTLAMLPDVDGSEEATDFLEPPLVFVDTAGCEFYERTDEGGSEGEGSKRNENEAELVRKHVEKLISFGVLPNDIGVLAAYQAQVAHLSALLKPDLPDLLIGTVDSLQGQEREAIVLSLVRSNAQREVGFLSEERRLNVAMTRAKRQLAVVGDSSTVANGSAYLKAWMAWLEENAEVRFAMDE